MRLSALLTPGCTVTGADPTEVEVSGLCCDSRRAAPGVVFAALQGERQSGTGFVREALERGAVAVLAAAPVAEAEGRAAVIVDPDPRRQLARMAARFFGRQPRCLVAVTGTNGKSTVVHLAAQIWRHTGCPAASLGTLGIDAGAWQEGGALTTPDPIELHHQLDRLAAAGIDHVALEASSHGLEQRRLDGCELAAGAFTNLSRDHLDYHADEQAYLRAKCRLFNSVLTSGRIAVLPADQAAFEVLAPICRERKIEIMDYGRRAGRIRLAGQAMEPDGQRLDLVIDGQRHTVLLRLAGDFQADNLMAALGLVLATGTAAGDALARVDRLVPPPGRMQEVARTSSGAAIVVDYAHTPDALDRVLAALRPQTPGALVVVFGCGGDRDPGKRRLMGAVAAERADRVIVTDDNPRSERPETIRRAILEAVPAGLEIGDRRAAIRHAVHSLKAGDTLLVAGKGHERYQLVGEAVLPFDDAAEARAAAEAREPVA